jgi:hypothetical protein
MSYSLVHSKSQVFENLVLLGAPKSLCFARILFLV